MDKHQVPCESYSISATQYLYHHCNSGFKELVLIEKYEFSCRLNEGIRELFKQYCLAIIFHLENVYLSFTYLHFRKIVRSL